MRDPRRGKSFEETYFKWYVDEKLGTRNTGGRRISAGFHKPIVNIEYGFDRIPRRNIILLVEHI